MRLPTTILCLSSLLTTTASASKPTSFDAPGSESSTVAAPALDTTIVYETSTYYLTSAITLTVPVTSPIPIKPANSSYCTTDASMPTLNPSVVVSGNVTLVPVTLWEGTTTRLIYPQNSTAIALPTVKPNGTTTIVGTSTVVSTTVVSSSKTATGASSSKDETSATASVSEVPVSGAGRGTENAVLGLGAVAGVIVLL